MAAGLAGCATEPATSDGGHQISTFVFRRPPPPIFAMDPVAHAAFVGTGQFSAGARFRLTSYSLSRLERLRLERRDTESGAATVIATWSRPDFEKTPQPEVILEQSGVYALSLYRVTAENVEIPVSAAAVVFERETGVLRFSSGTVVFIAIDGTGMPVSRREDPVRIGTDPIFDADSELNKLESSIILEKARHSVRQDLIVDFDPGARVKALEQETFPKPGENDFSAGSPAQSRRSEAWGRYQVALRQVRQEIVARLVIAGLEIKQESATENWMLVAVSSEEALRTLQRDSQIHMIWENHEVELT